MLGQLVKSKIIARYVAGNRQYGSSSKALDQFRGIINTQLNEIKDAGTFKSERIITSAQKTEISVAGNQSKVLNFCANNYLGLAVSNSLRHFRNMLFKLSK